MGYAKEWTTAYLLGGGGLFRGFLGHPPTHFGPNCHSQFLPNPSAAGSNPRATTFGGSSCRAYAIPREKLTKIF